VTNTDFDTNQVQEKHEQLNGDNTEQS